MAKNVGGIGFDEPDCASQGVARIMPANKRHCDKARLRTFFLISAPLRFPIRIGLPELVLPRLCPPIVDHSNDGARGRLFTSMTPTLNQCGGATSATRQPAPWH